MLRLICFASTLLIASQNAIGLEANKDYLTPCNAGQMSSCNILGNQLSNRDNPQDQLKGVSFYRKACDSDYARSCSSLGYVYFKGQGVTTDLAKAASFYRKACELGEVEACDSASLEILQARLKSLLDKIRGARERCAAGDADGCRFLGNSYEDGEGVTLDLSKAAEYFLKACDLGQAAGCMDLAIQYENGKGVPKDLSKAQAFYAKAVPLYFSGCDSGHGQSCARLGNIYEAGYGGLKDSQKAILFYRKGCELGHGGACANALRLSPESARE